MKLFSYLMTFISAILIVAALTTNAHAYLDSGTGSFIIQMILGGVAGLIVVFKVFWHRIREILGLDK